VEAPRNETTKPNPHETAVGTPPLQPKPKRKYTTSEKSRAASRKNLEKANQAPHWLKYRRTDRRDAACYKALEKAVAEMRRFDSPHYGLGFKRGTYCASLTRSLALAGETREEYEAHLERMRKAFAPLSERDRKLVLAAAQAVWRRLRVFGGQGRWELYAVASILGELIAEREAEAERRAAAGPAGEEVEPVDPDDDPFGSERAVKLGIDLILLLQEDAVEKEAERLNRRIEMLLAALGQEPQEPAEEDEAAVREDTDDEELTAAVRGNPIGKTQRLAATLNRNREPLKDPSQWRNAPDAGQAAESGAEEKGKRKSDPRPCENAADLAQRGGLMRLLLRKGVNNPEFSRLEGPDGRAVWIDLWQRAFGIDPARRDQSSVLAAAEITWERIQMHLQHREKEAAQVKKVLESCIAARQAAVGGIDDRFRPAGLIDDSPKTSVAGSRSCEAETDNGPRKTKRRSQSSIDNQQLVVALLGALGVYKCVGAVLEAGKDIKAAYYQMLVALYGELPGFDFFKRKEPTVSELADDLSSFVQGLLSPKNGPSQQEKVKQIKWQGGSGRQPGVG